jgi:hypothetical protein
MPVQRGMTREQIFEALIGERRYQQQKWSAQPGRERFRYGHSIVDSAEHLHEVDAFVNYVLRYALKANDVASTAGGPFQALCVLRKVAALCLACFEQHGVPTRQEEQEAQAKIDAALGANTLCGLSDLIKNVMAGRPEPMGAPEVERALFAGAQASGVTVDELLASMQAHGLPGGAPPGGMPATDTGVHSDLGPQGTTGPECCAGMGEKTFVGEQMSMGVSTAPATTGYDPPQGEKAAHGPPLSGKSLADEEWREYTFPTGSTRGEDDAVEEGFITHRIDNPQLLFMRPGGTTHRVLDAAGVVHCVPAPGEKGCVLRWKNKPGKHPCAF